MRTLVLAALTMVTAFGGSAAQAQRLGGPGASYPVPSGQVHPAYPAQGYPTQGYPSRGYPTQARPSQAYPGPRPQQGGPQAGRPAQQRWVRDQGGRWYGGSNAPGGWNAYRQPSRGYRLPRYWIADSFFLDDFAGYGLAPPPEGYSWHRYYDDAVLIDRRGKVFDWSNRVNWDGGYAGEGGYAEAGDGYAYAQGGAGGYSQSYQRPPVVRGGYVQGDSYASGGYQVAPGVTVVTIQGAPSVTTTTTTEYVEETRSRYVAPRRHVWHRPACGCRVVAPVRHRVWHRPVRVVEQPIQGS